MSYFDTLTPTSDNKPGQPTNIPRYHVLFPTEINICIISIIIDKMYKVFPKDLVQYMKKVASFEGLPFIPTGKRITFLNKELLRELFTPEVVDTISTKFNGSEANEFK